MTTLAVVLVLVVPASLLLVYWLRRFGRLAQVAAVLAVFGLLAYAGIRADGRLETAFGPAHPQSALVQQPFDKVEWVWSGGVTTTAAIVKARLVENARAVRLVLSEREDLSSPVFADPVSFDSAGDRVASFTLAGLKPDTQYFYAVEADGAVDRVRVGRFQTFPEGTASFSIAFGSCAEVGSNGAVFDAIRAQAPLLYLVTGDFHYENITTNDPAAFAKAYQTILTSPAQAALYQSTPVAYVWDDHDYGGNNSNANSASREAARFSYREYVPHYDLPAGAAHGAIYQAFTIGRVRFVMTDTRSERDAEQLLSGSNSILGSEQRDWLKREIAAASESYALVVWVNSVPWIAPDDATGDDWGAYAEERREIADFIEANRIDNLIMLSGDAHMLAIDDGSNSGYASSGAPGFPVFHAAALDRPGSTKGGPYSEGAYPGAGQYGLLKVNDDGQQVTVEMQGLDWQGNEIVSYTFSVPAPD